MKKVLVIGAGTMGTVHVEAYASMENVNLAGIVDIDITKAKALGDFYGTQVFDSLERAIEGIEDIDVIDICLPTYLHKSYVRAAADAGKHVICEKPLARNLQDAREMIDYCEEKNVKLFVGHVVRFFNEYKQAKELIQNNALGNPAIAKTTRGGIFPQAWNDWYADFDKSGGLIVDMIIHDFDFLRWCFGEVERVYAKSLLGRNYLRLEYALVTLRFTSGVIAHVEGTWAHEGFSSKFEISGKEGIIDYDSAAAVSITSTSREKEQEESGVAVPESPLKRNPYFLELQHFISCIESEEEPIVTAEDAYKALEIATAALESIKSEKAVELTNINR